MTENNIDALVSGDTVEIRSGKRKGERYTVKHTYVAWNGKAQAILIIPGAAVSHTRFQYASLRKV